MLLHHSLQNIAVYWNYNSNLFIGSFFYVPPYLSVLSKYRIEGQVKLNMTTCLLSYSQETRHEISMSVWDSIKTLAVEKGYKGKKNTKSFDWTVVIKCFC